MILHPIKTPLIMPGHDIVKILMSALTGEKLDIEDGDVLVIAESVVATAQGRMQRLDQISPSSAARRMAEIYKMDPAVVEVVIQEADEIYGGMEKILLTVKDGWFTANAGVDVSNAPEGHVVLQPAHPFREAERIRRGIQKRTGKRIGTIIADSRTIPLKKGVIGVALATAGMEAVEDLRGKKDIFGRELRVTFRAIADDLASAAQLLMGEADEQVPIVLIKGAPIKLTEKSLQKMDLSPEECIYMSILGTDDISPVV